MILLSIFVMASVIILIAWGISFLLFARMGKVFILLSTVGLISLFFLYIYWDNGSGARYTKKLCDEYSGEYIHKMDVSPSGVHFVNVPPKEIYFILSSSGIEYAETGAGSNYRRFFLDNKASKYCIKDADRDYNTMELLRLFQEDEKKNNLSGLCLAQKENKYLLSDISYMGYRNDRAPRKHLRFLKLDGNKLKELNSNGVSMKSSYIFDNRNKMVLAENYGFERRRGGDWNFEESYSCELENPEQLLRSVLKTGK